jgi:hypothetical protein
MEIAMIKTLLVFGTALGLVAATGVASAGTCTMEIDKLQKQLSSSDAGMGPTGTGQVAETGQELHPPTDTMNKATGNKAASSDDVANQNVGQPTDAEAAQSGEFGASAEPTEADAALERARQFDLAGNESGCMEEVAKAKSHLGAQ